LLKQKHRQTSFIDTDYICERLVPAQAGAPFPPYGPFVGGIIGGGLAYFGVEGLIYFGDKAVGNE